MSMQQQMDPYIKATHTKRFVVEDSITKVTSDGEPHGMMTMIAVLSGLLAAIVILAILVSLVGCKKSKRKHSHLAESAEKLPTYSRRSDDLDNVDSKRSSISTTYTRATSVEDGLPTPTHQPTVSVIYSGNLNGNLNSAFVGNELNLNGSFDKKKKRTHWSDEVETHQTRIKETAIEMSKY